VILIKETRENDESVLAEGLREGDPAAFEQLVRQYKDRIYNVVYRFVGNHEDARDIAQETFIRAHRALSSYRGHARLSTWLHAIAANLTKNRLRDQARRGRNLATSLDAIEEQGGSFEAGETPREAAEKRELDEALQRCLDALPDNFRVAFILRTHEDLCYEDIADATGCPVGTVKSRLNEARKRLHGCLRRHGVLT